MKYMLALLVFTLSIYSCSVSHPTAATYATPDAYEDTTILQSLFNDKSSTISEDNIQKILNGNYQLPKQLRVAVVKMQSLQNNQSRSWYWRTDEEYLKTQQAYLDSFTTQLTRSSRVSKVSIIPDLLLPKSPTFTNIREIAVRMQADVVMAYSINSDIYAKYKAFAKADIKAFATTQLILLDVRTGLVPFSAIATKDALSQRKKEEMDNAEAERRIQNQAILLTITDIGGQLTNFLKN